MSVWVGGLVALWGRVIVGELGVYRARYAYPLALWRGLVDDLADIYGVPIIPVPTTTGEVIAQAEWAAKHQLRALAP